MSHDRARPPDYEQRRRAIVERRRNVLIDAGAGTGKTTLLVQRLVELLAPTSDEKPRDMGRIAAVTFTRRAAGELRLKIRETLLRELGAKGLVAKRRKQLESALGKLDGAYVGTMHGFADRLLRQHPMEAGLSPGYTIADDSELLQRETFALLQHGAETGSLASLVTPDPAAARASEAEATVLEALRAGLRAESLDTEHYTFHGLEGLVRAFIAQRDRPPAEPELAPFDVAAFQAGVDAIVELVRRVTGQSRGARWLRDTAERLEELRGENQPAVLYAALEPVFRGYRDAKRGEDFAGEAEAWEVQRALVQGKGKLAASETPLVDTVLAPMRRWLAVRLVRLFPVVLALYERVKARHRAVDEIDLLLKLRHLLASSESLRGEYQAMFDHVFVDEFQDTDPLQAEVLLYLCASSPVVSSVDAIELAPGKLTIVGDPKQSIYRFRRADVAMYDAFRRQVARGEHLSVALTANFRSARSLIDWFNERFTGILGPPPDDGAPSFDPASGVVSYQPLRSGRREDQSSTVHALPIEPAAADAIVGVRRRLEAEAVARYLHWLVLRSDREVFDELSNTRRPIRYGDIAVLALETTNLPLLFPELDAMGVPYAARGGTLFLQDELHRQFLLGLRALANRDDGVAEAALLRPPFFAVDLVDIVRARVVDEGADDEAAARARAARARVRELRRRRFERSPGSTARDLLEQTAFGRSVAVGANGLMRLERLRELCLVVDQLAAAEGLDYDGVTARMRDWVDAPVALDPPHPVGEEAVQILTVHQAKGLEFPVVVLWDICAGWRGRADQGPWRVARDESGWELALDRLGWEEPAGLGLMDAEKRYRQAERKRVVYVAATRARDLLVVPHAVGKSENEAIASLLLKDQSLPMVLSQQPYREGQRAAWSRGLDPMRPRELVTQGTLEHDIAERWARAAAEAVRPRYMPTAVAAAAAAAGPIREPEVAQTSEPAPRERRIGRYGPVFGDVVHKAIGLALGGATVQHAVEVAAAACALDAHLDEAANDVARTLDVLRREGLASGDVRVEYPVFGLRDGSLLVGYLDLVHASHEAITIVDFKTDRPPTGPVEQSHGAYVAQARGYASLLDAAGSRPTRCALLFTAESQLRWI